MTFTPTLITPTWNFQTNTATGFVAGFYDHGAVPSNFTATATLGTANSAYAAHVYLVASAQVLAGPTTIRVTGTSVNDDGSYTPGDTEDIVWSGTVSAGDYQETAKKFVGGPTGIAIDFISGTAFSMNYGLAKYWDYNNTDFLVVGIECLWEADATDSAAGASDIFFRHHSATGWTYSAAGPALPPTAYAQRSVDLPNELNTANEQGAWKRANLSLMVNGSDSEGIMFEVLSNNTGVGNLSFRNMNLQVTLRG